MANQYGANTDPQQQAGDTPGGRKVTNIRVGDHSGERFDRVVFDLSGGGTPGFDVSYTDSATHQGSGAPIAVPGQAVLAVTLTGIDWTNQSLPEYGGAPIDGPGGSIAGVRWDGSSEGQTQVFVGTTGRLPFRVEVLGNPTRVFIDVAQLS